MTPAQLQLWSLVATILLAVLNIALIPLIKGAMQGQVERLKSQFEKLIEAHNASEYGHPAMTRATRDEVDRVARSAQAAAAGVATIAQEAAAGVAKTAQEAVAKVAADAAQSVVRVREGIEAQFKDMRGEIHQLSEEFSKFRLEVAEWKPRTTSAPARVRKVR